MSPFHVSEKRGSIVMGMVLWRVTEKLQTWEMAENSFSKNSVSTSCPTAEILDGAAGCVVKDWYERNVGFLQMVVPEAQNDRTSSRIQVWRAIQDSGPQLLSAQTGPYVRIQVTLSPVRVLGVLCCFAVLRVALRCVASLGQDNGCHRKPCRPVIGLCRVLPPALSLTS